MPLFIHQLARDEPITVYGGDDKMLDFTYVDDCVDGIARGVEALAAGRVANETINLAYGQGNTLVRAAELIAGELGRRAEIAIAPSLARRGDALRRRHPQGARAARLATRRRRWTRASRARSPGSASGAPAIPRRTAASSSDPTCARATSRMASSSRPAPAPEHVLALFGPTASGKSAVAGILARAPRRRGDLRRLGRALRRPAGPDGGAGLPGPARRRRAARGRGLGRRVSAARARGDRRDPRAGGRRSSSAGPASTCARRSRASSCRRRRRPGERARWEAVYDRLGPEGAHAAARRARPGGRSARPRERPPARRPRARARGGRRTRSRPPRDRLWSRGHAAADDRSSGSTCRSSELDARIEERDARDGRGGRRRGGAGRAGRGRSRRPRARCSASSEFATLPARRGGRGASSQATRRLARYQRKWLRRLRGVATLDGNRPAGGGRR